MLRLGPGCTHDALLLRGLSGRAKRKPGIVILRTRTLASDAAAKGDLVSLERSHETVRSR